MRNRFLSPLLCIVLLLPQSICTCAVASISCSDPGCGDVTSCAAPGEQEQGFRQISENSVSSSHRCSHHHDGDEAVAPEWANAEIADASLDPESSNRSHKHKRHQPDCPTVQVQNDRAYSNAQVKISDDASTQLTNLEPVANTPKVHGFGQAAPTAVYCGGPPLYVIHRTLLI